MRAVSAADERSARGCARVERAANGDNAAALAARPIVLRNLRRRIVFTPASTRDEGTTGAANAGVEKTG